jgi:hypothetical protein
LGDWPLPMVRLACDRCGRQGNIVATLSSPDMGSMKRCPIYCT